MDYTHLLRMYEEEKYLINMVSAEDILRFGHALGLNEKSRVLDLCCGYGAMLKIWKEAFGIRGTGVDRDATLIETGRLRLPDDGVRLICGDVLRYESGEPYDVVVCTELSTGLFGGFGEGVSFLERFLKQRGTLVFGRLFSEIPNPPRELTDFDGPLPTLGEIMTEVRQCGYLATSMVSGGTASWERYIMRDSKLSLEKLRQSPGDARNAAWNEKWTFMYCNFRRPYESWGLFGIEKIPGYPALA